MFQGYLRTMKGQHEVCHLRLTSLSSLLNSNTNARRFLSWNPTPSPSAPMPKHSSQTTRLSLLFPQPSQSSHPALICPVKYPRRASAKLQSSIEHYLIFPNLSWWEAKNNPFSVFHSACLGVNIICLLCLACNCKTLQTVWKEGKHMEIIPIFSLSLFRSCK